MEYTEPEDVLVDIRQRPMLDPLEVSYLQFLADIETYEHVKDLLQGFEKEFDNYTRTHIDFAVAPELSAQLTFKRVMSSIAPKN